MINRNEKTFYKINKLHKNLRYRCFKKAVHPIIKSNKLTFFIGSFNDLPIDLEKIVYTGRNILIIYDEDDNIGTIEYNSKKNQIEFTIRLYYNDEDFDNERDFCSLSRYIYDIDKNLFNTIIDKFIEIVLNNYNIFTIITDFRNEDIYDDIVEIFSDYIYNTIINNIMDTNIFNYLNEDIKFKLIYRNHKNKKSLFI